MNKLNMVVKVKLRFYILVYCMRLLGYISPHMASRLYCHIRRNIYKYMIVRR